MKNEKQENITIILIRLCCNTVYYIYTKTVNYTVFPKQDHCYIFKQVQEIWPNFSNFCYWYEELSQHCHLIAFFCEMC